MSKSTISTFELFDLFPDAESARLYLEDRLWPEGPKCLTCKSGERITVRQGGRKGFYLCNACQLEFTIRTGTIFERSHVPLHKWLYAMYLLVTARKGISSMQLSKEIGITQKSAWFMLQRLREACGKNLPMLRGMVEIDETFVGGLVNGMASTNGIESVWAVLKRGLNGVYHQISKKHLPRYVDEFTFRLNDGDVKRHTLARLDSFVDAIVGKRLTYRRLTA